MNLQTGIYLAQSSTEREAVLRLRYQVYVEELGRYRSIADHKNQLFVEDIDENSRLYYAVEDGQIVDLTCLGPGDDDDDDDDGFNFSLGSSERLTDGDDDDDDDGTDCGFEIVDGVLKIRSDTAILIVTATDDLGNSATCELDLCAVCPPDGGDDDDDDDRDDDAEF